MRDQGTVSVAANGSSGNVLAGRNIEFPERPSMVRFLAASAATGVVAQINAGTELIMQEAHIAPANRFPVDPDDQITKDVVMPGRRLSLVFRNTTGAAIVVQWAVDSIPVR